MECHAAAQRQEIRSQRCRADLYRIHSRSASQHCGNHGAMSTNATVNGLMGVCDDLVGGSSLMWRYHHQVSHHIHCNDAGLDEDVMVRRRGGKGGSD
jgi:fatty acid desaturase